MKKTWMVLLVGMISIGLFLSGCGTSNVATKTTKSSAAATKTSTTTAKSEAKKAPENVTVHFANFSSSGGHEKDLAAMKAAFEKTHPNIKIDIQTTAYKDYFTQLQTNVAGGQAPDAFELNYENFVTYAKKGLLLNVGPQFKKTNFDPSTLNKNALEAFQADGNQYGLPESFSNVLLFYNKDLFDKAKVAYPTKDWTWAREQAAAEKIRALGKNIFGIYQPIQFWEFYKVTQQNGGSILSADQSKFTVNSPQNIETLQFMMDRSQKSNVMPTKKQMSGMGDWDLFKSGRLGMIVTGIWAFDDFTKNNKFAWDVQVEPGNLKKATHFFANGLVISADTKVADASLQWAEFMSASKEAAQIRVKSSWELPASKYPDVLDAYLKQTPPNNRQAVFDSLNYLVTPPVVEQNSEMTDIVNLYLSKADDGTLTAKDALDQMQKELESKIKLK